MPQRLFEFDFGSGVNLSAMDDTVSESFFDAGVEFGFTIFVPFGTGTASYVPTQGSINASIGLTIVPADQFVALEPIDTGFIAGDYTLDFINVAGSPFGGVDVRFVTPTGMSTQTVQPGFSGTLNFTGDLQRIEFLLGNGQSSFQIESLNAAFVCFTRGTRIATPGGEVPVEALAVGDPVRCADGADRPIRWIGSRRLGPAALAAAPHLAPIRIGEGALGQGLPRRDLTVSPQHRMVFSGARAELMFGEEEVFVPAKALVDDSRIRVDRAAETVEYFHVMLDRHDVILAEGAATESFHPGDAGLDALGAAVRDELFEIFPELETAPEAYGAAARPVLRRYEAALLTALTTAD
ncbi:MAG: Hint domain-containing protein [Pseudomonadota bacterium]